jgi:hypothetical protein
MYPRSNYRKGDWKATCDRCGFDFHASELKPTWDNLYVCKCCWESRHPQDFLRGVPDDPNVPWTRPSLDQPAIVFHGDEGAQITFAAGTVQHNWNVDLTESRVVRLSATGARAGDKIVIYKTGDDSNTLYVTTGLLDSGVSV